MDLPEEDEAILAAELACKKSVGMGEEEAAQAAAAAGLAWRVVERDGEMMMLTMDYQPARLNASINSGEVTSCRLG